MDWGIADGENKTTGLSIRGAGLEKNHKKNKISSLFVMKIQSLMESFRKKAQKHFETARRLPETM